MTPKIFVLDDCAHGRQIFGRGDQLTAKNSGFEGVAESLLVGLVVIADILSPTGTFTAAALELISL